MQSDIDTSTAAVRGYASMMAANGDRPQCVELLRALAAERDSAAARLSTAEKALASMEAAALAYQELATCYRVGKNPSESLHTRLEHAEAALAAIKEPGK